MSKFIIELFVNGRKAWYYDKGSDVRLVVNKLVKHLMDFQYKSYEVWRITEFKPT
jgi:hypothetical protein